MTTKAIRLSENAIIFTFMNECRTNAVTAEELRRAKNGHAHGMARSALRAETPTERDAIVAAMQPVKLSEEKRTHNAVSRSNHSAAVDSVADITYIKGDADFDVRALKFWREQQAIASAAGKRAQSRGICGLYLLQLEDAVADHRLSENGRRKEAKANNAKFEPTALTFNRPAAWGLAAKMASSARIASWA